MAAWGSSFGTSWGNSWGDVGATADSLFGHATTTPSRRRAVPQKVRHFEDPIIKQRIREDDELSAIMAVITECY